MARKSTGKRLRFEIFKRDGFKCIYCGVTPVQSVLRIDHVVPVAKGGTNSHENLVTACHDCNSGKAAIPLEKKRLTKPMLTESLRDHAEQIRKYLKVQKDITDARYEVVSEIVICWERELGYLSEEMFGRLYGLVCEWPAEKIMEAIQITSIKMGPSEEGDSYRATKRAKYFYGVLRKWRQDKN